ncbi:MAG: outer membrane protein assembly factor BamA [Nitrospirae bacterium]|nr:outer membrane protein assembly factor BamA [Nitrospirota bacterium]
MLRERTEITMRSICRQAFLITVCSVCCLCLLFSARPASAATIGRVEIYGLHLIEKQEMLEMLGLREGDAITAESIRSGIKRAFRKGIFDDISVDASDSEPSLVTVQIREKDMVRKVDVQGDYPLSAGKVRDLLILKTAEVMRYDLVDQAAADLEEHFALLGFPEAKIEITASRKTVHDHNVILTVTISAGSSLVIKALKISGTDLVGAGDLRISAGDIFDQIRIRKELQRVKERLKKDGYYRPEVGPYDFQDGILTVAIKPGKKLETVIDGNSVISTRRLEKEMPFFESEMFNDEAVDEAVNRMLALYHMEGYSLAQIAPVVRAEQEQIQVTFFVFEGRQTRVGAIRFSGATLPAGILQSVLELKEGGPYNPDLRQRDRDTLGEYYTALGYLEAWVGEIEVRTDEATGRIDLNVPVEEGMLTTIEMLDINGVDEEKKRKFLALIPPREGQPYNEVEILDARFRIIDQYAREGYANIDVVVQRTIEKHRARVLFIINEGRKKTIGKTVVAGNERTRYGVIKREIAHTEGSPYSFSALARERQKLYKLGLFTTVEIEASEADGDQQDLLVRVKEGNAGTFEFGVGYAEYEHFRSFFEIGYRNLFGMNRQGLFRTELSSLARRFILQYNEPWFMGTTLPLRVLLLHENKKELTAPSREVRYQLERNSVTVGIEKKLSDTVKSELYYEFSLVKTTDVQPDVVLSREDVGTLAISSVRTSLIFDTRDNPFEPKKGLLAGITLKIASPLLFSETHFAKVTAYASFFQELHKRVVLGLSARGGIAQGFGKTDELPIVERYFLGGRSSVRGYEQDMLGPKGSDGNATGGDAFVMGNVELRTDIGRSISLVPFLDFGNVWINITDLSPADIKYTVGLGLRYATPVGPLRVDYGYKLTRDDICVDRTAPLPPKCSPESRGEIHFSIGHAF